MSFQNLTLSLHKLSLNLDYYLDKKKYIFQCCFTPGHGLVVQLQWTSTWEIVFPYLRIIFPPPVLLYLSGIVTPLQHMCYSFWIALRISSVVLSTSWFSSLWTKQFEIFLLLWSSKPNSGLSIGHPSLQMDLLIFFLKVFYSIANMLKRAKERERVDLWFCFHCGWGWRPRILLVHTLLVNSKHECKFKMEEKKSKRPKYQLS